MQSIRKCGLAFGVALCLGGCVAGTQASDTQTPASKPAGKGGEVEAPNVYSTTDLGLWDGRPSLGGVWVAAADVKDPDHVLIRNTATGKSVTGALFRRERNNPGPRLQVSSEAAQALGMLAGAPARLSVVALRRAETAAPAAAPAAQASAQPQANTAANLASTKPAPSQPATALKPVATAAPSVAAVATTPARVATPGAPPVATARITSVPVTSVSGPLVQLGTYSIEANARASAAKIANSGLSAAVQSGQTGKKEMWRVVVAPAPGTDARTLLSKVKGLGFPDAYIVTK